MEKKIKIAIVDNHQLIIDGLVSLFEHFPQIEVVMEALNGQSLLDQLSVKSTNDLPTLILLDVEMPVLDGIETLKILTKEYPGIKPVMLSMYDSRGYVDHCFELGAMGYLLKDDPIEEVVKSVEKVIAGEKTISTTYSSRTFLKSLEGTGVTIAPVKAELDAKDLEIMKLMLNDVKVKEMPDMVNLGIGAVNTRIAKIYEITETNGLIALYEYAKKHHLFPEGILFQKIPTPTNS